MLTLHHCLSARSFRPLWAMEELGLEYELKMHPFPPRFAEKAFLDVNPLGTIPVLIHGPVFMTESTAICEYLASLAGQTELRPSNDSAEFADYLNFMSYGEATLTFPLTLVLRYRHLEIGERKAPRIADDYARWHLARLRLAEKRLANHSYMCGKAFTLADISVGYALMLGEALGLAGEYKSVVTDYWSRLQERAAFKRSLVAQNRAAEECGLPTRGPLDL